MIANRYGGANTNATGLRFEKNTDLETALIDKGYTVRTIVGIAPRTSKESVKGVYDGKGLVGYLCAKNGLRYLLAHEYGVEMTDVLTKKLLPDEAFLNVRESALHILEKKFQCGTGSVDEKIQTGAFKLYEYQRLMQACSQASGEDFDVTYDYVLSDWFQNPCYDDVFEYNDAHGIGHYFSQLPMNVLGL